MAYSQSNRVKAPIGTTFGELLVPQEPWSWTSVLSFIALTVCGKSSGHPPSTTVATFASMWTTTPVLALKSVRRRQSRSSTKLSLRLALCVSATRHGQEVIFLRGAPILLDVDANACAYVELRPNSSFGSTRVGGSPGYLVAMDSFSLEYLDGTIIPLPEGLNMRVRVQ